LRASTPRLRGLCSSGCYSFWAETVPEAYTLPPHVSMLTGCPVAKHGVSWNHYIEESYPNVPTLFEVAKGAGYSTALVAGKMKFIALTRPGTLDWHYLPPDEPVRDDEIAAQAEHILREHQPTLLVVHFPDVDNIGHESGWGSAEQMEAIQRADKAVGLLLNVVSQLGLADSTLIIITSDHGGAGKGHDENDPRSHFIPWIASGPGLRQDFDLTRVLERPVQIQDTFATICALLSIPPGEANEGRPILEIVAEAH
jgi:arylsulfatase A-like enzyme